MKHDHLTPVPDSEATCAAEAASEPVPEAAQDDPRGAPTSAAYADVVDEMEHQLWLELREGAQVAQAVAQEAQAAFARAQQIARCAQQGYEVFTLGFAQKYGLGPQDQISPRGRIIRA